MSIGSLILGSLGLFRPLLGFDPAGQVPVHLLCRYVDAVVYLLTQPHFLLRQRQHALVLDADLPQ